MVRVRLVKCQTLRYEVESVIMPAVGGVFTAASAFVSLVLLVAGFATVEPTADKGRDYNDQLALENTQVSTSHDFLCPPVDRFCCDYCDHHAPESYTRCSCDPSWGDHDACTSAYETSSHCCEAAYGLNYSSCSVAGNCCTPVGEADVDSYVGLSYAVLSAELVVLVVSTPVALAADFSDDKGCGLISCCVFTKLVDVIVGIIALSLSAYYGSYAHDGLPSGGECSDTMHFDCYSRALNDARDSWASAYGSSRGILISAFAFELFADLLSLFGLCF